MDELIRMFEQLIPVLRQHEISVRPLGGGLTNRNYLVQVNGESYVLRIAGTGTELLGIDREREGACCRAAAAAGVAPAVIAYLPAPRALIRAFVTGKLLTSDDVKNPEILRRLAQTVRRSHDHPVATDLGTFSAFATVRRYHALARERGVVLPLEIGEAQVLFDRIEKELKTDEPACLCHNDLLAGNFIDDGTTMRIIDWEYGGLGDRFFDLGNCAVNLQLDAEQEQVLLKAYFGEVRPDHLRRLRLMRLVSDLRETTWGYLQSAISKLTPEEPYVTYGKRHLDRFLAGARSMGTDQHQ